MRADDGHIDLCRCQPSEDPDDSAKAERDLPCQLCSVCALTVVHGHTRWMLVSCNECSTRATDLNHAAGRLVIPIGIHSLVNGAAMGASADTEELERQVGELLAFMGSMVRSLGQLQDHRRRIVKARCHRLGLIGPELIDLDEYVAAARAAGYTEKGSFNRYVGSIRRRGGSRPGRVRRATAP